MWDWFMAGLLIGMVFGVLIVIAIYIVQELQWEKRKR